MEPRGLDEKRADARFCSVKCRVAAHREAKAAAIAVIVEEANAAAAAAERADARDTALQLLHKAGHLL
jgi:hypothetical protein